MSTSCALYDPVLEKAVRVNWDGYPERMLGLLNTHWCHLEKEDDWAELFSRGEIRSLGTELVTTEWYGNSQAFYRNQAEDLFDVAAVDYVYKYFYADDVWRLV